MIASRQRTRIQEGKGNGHELFGGLETRPLDNKNTARGRLAGGGHGGTGSVEACGREPMRRDYYRTAVLA